MRHEWVVRFDYGTVRPVGAPAGRSHGERGRSPPSAGPDKLVLRGPRLPHRPTTRRHVDEFDVARGRRADLLDDLGPVARATPGRSASTTRDRRDRSPTTRELGRRAATDDVPHADVVRRSLLTLRLMTHERHRRHRRGADHLAARGLRRRAQLGLPLLLAARRRPHPRVAARRRATPTRPTLWRRLAAARRRRRPRRPADHVRRRRRRGACPSATLDHLPGYAGSRPVRIGNGAVDAAADRRPRRGDDRPRAGPRAPASSADDDAWALQRALVDRPRRAPGSEPDNGLWEIRGPQRHFTHSRVMVWVAFDRAVAGGRAARPRRARSSAWRDAARPGARGGPRRRASTPSAAPSPSTTTPREVDASLLMLPAGRLHRRRRPADARHHRGRSRRT